MNKVEFNDTNNIESVVSHDECDNKIGKSERVSFTPEQKCLPAPIYRRSNPPPVTLEIDKERGMPYYGKNISSRSVE